MHFLNYFFIQNFEIFDFSGIYYIVTIFISGIRLIW